MYATLFFFFNKKIWKSYTLCFFENNCSGTACIHGRQDGESFGLAVAECGLAGKPLITHGTPPQHQDYHLQLWGQKARVYNSEAELLQHMEAMNPEAEKLRATEYVNLYAPFTPRAVMLDFLSNFGILGDVMTVGEPRRRQRSVSQSIEDTPIPASPKAVTTNTSNISNTSEDIPSPASPKAVTSPMKTMTTPKTTTTTTTTATAAVVKVTTPALTTTAAATLAAVATQTPHTVVASINNQSPDVEQHIEETTNDPDAIVHTDTDTFIQNDTDTIIHTDMA